MLYNLTVARDELQINQIKRGYAAVERLLEESLKLDKERNKNIENFCESAVSLALRFKLFKDECLKCIESSKSSIDEYK